MSIEHEPKGISRRSFLLGAAASAGAIIVGGTLSGISKVLAAPPRPSTRNPLYIPPTVSPNGYSLTVLPTLVDLGLGNLSNVWAYNGLLPGPTFLASRGDVATITLNNRLSQDTITHWHGMIVDELNDGAPRLAIPPLGTYNYNFPINQRAALNWYHPTPT